MNVREEDIVRHMIGKERKRESLVSYAKNNLHCGVCTVGLRTRRLFQLTRFMFMGITFKITLFYVFEKIV